MITKAIIPIAGLGTRFLPLSKIVPKELWPLVDKPVLQYVVEEAAHSGIKEIIFVLPVEKKFILDYFQKPQLLEKMMKEKKKGHLLLELKSLQELSKNISFSFVLQKKPLGDGAAVLLAQKKIGSEPCAVLFADDIVYSKTPCLLQLSKVFKTCEKPILSLFSLPRERLPAYGVVGTEKIASRLYKIKKIVEKPQIDKLPSNLAVVGKYIITPEFFYYLKKFSPSKQREIPLASAFAEMIKDGKMIYGYEFEGNWLECGTKSEWLKSNLYLSLKHPEIGNQLKQYLKNI